MRLPAVSGLLLLFLAILDASHGVQVAQRPPVPDASSKATGRIRGRVIAADTGLPVKGAHIVLMTVPFTRDSRAAVSDDQGLYEVPDLPVGRYTLFATKPGFARMSFRQQTTRETATPVDVAGGQVVERIDFALPRGAVVVVTVVDPVGEPVAEVSIEAMHRRFMNGARTLVSAGVYGMTNDLGQARVFGLPPGEYYFTARLASIATSSSVRLSIPTYFPDTLAADGARPVSVAAAQEAHITLPLLDGSPVTISGSVRRSDGSSFVASVPVTLLPQALTGDAVSTTPIAVQSDGTFRLAGVLPGSYAIVVRPQPAAQLPPDSGVEYARVPLLVGPEDLTGIVVTTHKGATLRGRILLDIGQPPVNLNPRALALSTYPTGVEPVVSSGSARTGSDWTFEINGVVATALLRPANTTLGWFAKSVVIDGKDVTETPITFEPGREYNDIQVTLTQKRATVTGTVVDPQGRASTSYVAVVFPDERDLRFARSPNILAARPDPEGRFSIAALPPGRFLIAALPSLDLGQEQDLELLARLAPRATTVVVAEGDTRTVSLRLVEPR